MMRKIIGETIGWTGLTLFGAGGLYGLYQFAHLVWRIAVSGDLGAMAAMSVLLGIGLIYAAVAILPSKPKASA